MFELDDKHHLAVVTAHMFCDQIIKEPPCPDGGKMIAGKQKAGGTTLAAVPMGMKAVVKKAVAVVLQKIGVIGIGIIPGGIGGGEAEPVAIGDPFQIGAMTFPACQ